MYLGIYSEKKPSTEKLPSRHNLEVPFVTRVSLELEIVITRFSRLIGSVLVVFLVASGCLWGPQLLSVNSLPLDKMDPFAVGGPLDGRRGAT